ncbi:hypothetical protein MAR_013887, partial [Mya arenaria]
MCLNTTCTSKDVPVYVPVRVCLFTTSTSEDVPEMSDLMEFIVQKFLTLSKTEPLACAVKLCTNNFLRNTNRYRLSDCAPATASGIQTGIGCQMVHQQLPQEYKQ